MITYILIGLVSIVLSLVVFYSTGFFVEALITFSETDSEGNKWDEFKSVCSDLDYYDSVEIGDRIVGGLWVIIILTAILMLSGLIGYLILLAF